MKTVYTVSLSGLPETHAAIVGELHARVSAAVSTTAQTVQARWTDRVLKARLWSGEKAAYAATIKWTMTSDLNAEVSAGYKFAYEIENGRPSKDLKDMLNTSTKVRRTADGRRFLVIPFRHNTPGNDAHAGAMPASVYQLAKGLTKSTVTGEGQRPTGQVTHLSARSGMRAAPTKMQTGFLTSLKSRQAAQTVARKYGWGGRLSAQALKDSGHSAAQVRRYQGMVKFAMPSGKHGAYSGYVSFRVMMEGSSGWIIPARPGQHLAEDAARAAERDLNNVLKAFFKA